MADFISIHITFLAIDMAEYITFPCHRHDGISLPYPFLLYLQNKLEIKTASFGKQLTFLFMQIKHMLDLFRVWNNQNLTFDSRKSYRQI